MDEFWPALSNPVMLHKYNYSNLDPMNFRDPSGLFGITELMGAVDVLGGLAGFAIAAGPAIVSEARSKPFLFHRTSMLRSSAVASKISVQGNRVSITAIFRPRGDVYADDKKNEISEAIEGVLRYWNRPSLVSPGGRIYSVSLTAEPAGLFSKWSSRLVEIGYGHPKCYGDGLASFETQTFWTCGRSRARADAHEFGHILGFRDTYDRATRTTWPGFEDDIMGNKSGGRVQWHHIRNLADAYR